MKIFKNRKMLVLLLALCLTFSWTITSFAIGSASKTVTVGNSDYTVNLDEHVKSFGKDYVKLWVEETSELGIEPKFTGEITILYKNVVTGLVQKELTVSFTDSVNPIFELPKNGYNIICAEADFTLTIGDNSSETIKIGFIDN